MINEVRPRVQISRPSAIGASRHSGAAAIETPLIALGANVSHPKFGGGVITDYEGRWRACAGAGQFDEAGARWLVLAYANLTVIC